MRGGTTGVKSDAGERSSTAHGLVVTSTSEEQTVLLGRAIGESLRVGDTVLLSGELGAGKTRMAQGMALGAGAPTDARSPTFVIVNEYLGRIRLSHCDLYRVSPGEVDELALDERLADGALAVEWPERGGSSLPGDALLVQIEVDPATETRTITLTPLGERAARLLSRASPVFEALSAAAGAGTPAR